MTTSSKTPAQPSGRSDLIKYIAEEAGNQEKAERILNKVLEGIVNILKEGKPMRFVGFGTFSVQDRVASEGRNPRTGLPIQIAAYKRPIFKAGQGLKEAVNPCKAIENEKKKLAVNKKSKE